MPRTFEQAFHMVSCECVCLFCSCEEVCSGRRVPMSLAHCKHKPDTEPLSCLLETLLSDCKMTKTYNRRDSQMVTHSSTSRPVQCLCMAERTGCPVFTDLWSYVLRHEFCLNMLIKIIKTTRSELLSYNRHEYRLMVNTIDRLIDSVITVQDYARQPSKSATISAQSSLSLAIPASSSLQSIVRHLSTTFA